MKTLRLIVTTLLTAIVVVGGVFVIYFLVVGIFFGESPRSPDAKRIANARAIESALELYKDENKVYPNNLEQLIPTYLAAMPVYPNNKTKYCTKEQLQYKYTLLPNGDFKLEYCLGDQFTATSKFKPGMNIVNSADYPK